MLDCKAIKIHGKECLRLTGSLTIYTVAQARRDIPALLEKQGSRVLDLTGIEEFDTAGVQFLIWLKGEVSGSGTALAIIHPSAIVAETLDLLRLSSTVCDATTVPTPSS